MGVAACRTYQSHRNCKTKDRTSTRNSS